MRSDPCQKSPPRTARRAVWLEVRPRPPCCHPHHSGNGLSLTLEQKTLFQLPASLGYLSHLLLPWRSSLCWRITGTKRPSQFPRTQRCEPCHFPVSLPALGTLSARLGTGDRSGWVFWNSVYLNQVTNFEYSNRRTREKGELNLGIQDMKSVPSKDMDDLGAIKKAKHSVSTCGSVIMHVVV